MRDREGRSHKSFWKTGELVVWVRQTYRWGRCTSIDTWTRENAMAETCPSRSSTMLMPGDVAGT